MTQELEVKVALGDRAIGRGLFHTLTIPSKLHSAITKLMLETLNQTEEVNIFYSVDSKSMTTYFIPCSHL